MARSRLKVILVEQDISIKELAARSGLPYGTVWAVANGRTPHIDTAYRISRALEIHINKVFPGLFTYQQIKRKSM